MKGMQVITFKNETTKGQQQKKISNSRQFFNATELKILINQLTEPQADSTQYIFLMRQYRTQNSLMRRINFTGEIKARSQSVPDKM